jgi:uncharacterized protein YwqG
MNALAALLSDSRLDVRTVAAAYLLNHGHFEAQAKAVLKEASQGSGLNAFAASQALERWEKGSAPRLEPAVAGPSAGAAIPPRSRLRQPLALPLSLDPHRALLEGALAPCILFDKSEGSLHSRGCRYGGLPLVPEGTAWPRSPEGPLHFLGQLDFEELAVCRGDALPELPSRGLLAFFYDVENQPWGHEPADQAFWRLVYVPPDVEPIVLHPPQELLEAERPVLPACQLLPSLGFSLPGWWDANAPVDPGFWSDVQAEDYSQLRRALVGGEHVDRAVDQLRGHPDWVQDDARNPGWNLLWQVGSDERMGLVWGSGGTLYLLIRDEDLAARRFERAWLILQCT